MSREHISIVDDIIDVINNATPRGLGEIPGPLNACMEPSDKKCLFSSLIRVKEFENFLSSRGKNR